MKKINFIVASVFLICTLFTIAGYAQSKIVKVEYYVDNDPGIGKGTSLNITADTNIINSNIALNTSGLTTGIHKLFVRAKDAKGSWSLTNSWLFYKPYGKAPSVATLKNISKIEYYVDNDPGLGNATNLSVNPASDISNSVIPVKTDTLSIGVHKIYARAKDANGSWSLTNSWLFYKPYLAPKALSALSNIIKIEYYIDKDPGIGIATDLPLSPNTDLSDLIIPINPEHLSPCQHVLFVRAMDANGSWSLVNSFPFLNKAVSPTYEPGDYMVQLDGVNDYIDLGTWFKVPSFTVSFWVKPDAGQASGAAIAALQNDLYLYSNPNVQSNYILSHLLQFDLAANTWNYITITVDSATQLRKVYLFGQLIDSNHWAYLPTAGFDLKFGNGGFFPNSYFKGQLDEIKLWNYNLSDDAIYANMNKQLTGTEIGLLGYWNFNNGCDVEAIDKSPNHHDGSILNGALKLPSTVPNIGQQVIPNKGGNTNIVTVKVYDNLFQQGAKARMTRTGFTDIIADTSVINEDGTIVTCSFNLTGKDTGLYNIFVDNPDTTQKLYPNSFTIEQGKPPDIWVNIIGRNAIRNGRPFTFQIAYGNNSNVDALSVPLWVVVPKEASIKFGFEITSIDSTKYLDSIPITYILDSLTSNHDSAQVIPLFFSRIPAEYSGVISFTLDSLSFENGEIQTWLNPPIFDSSTDEPPLNGDNEDCLVNTINNIIDLTPYGCEKDIGLAYLSLFPFTHIDTSTCKANDPFSCKFVSDNPTVGKFSDILATALKDCTLGLVEKIKKIGKILDKLIKANDIVNFLEQPCTKKIWRKISPISPIVSFDPNEKIGPDKYQKTETSFTYSVLFENKDSATAAAQEVTVIDTLDTSRFDISTFTFGALGFSDTSFVSTSPLQKSFSRDIDLRPEKNLIVNVAGRLDTTSRIVYWKFTSLDPSTMLLTDDPYLGFLPPNKNPPEGEGFVSFNVKPWDTLVTGTPIKNKATIIFDYNQPIITNAYGNTIDKILPVSHVLSLAPVQTDSNFIVKWSGSDSISGVRYYDIYVSDNDSAFVPWLDGITDTKAIFNGHSNHHYSFYSVSTDSAGNVEAPKLFAEATTSITTVLPVTLLNFSYNLLSDTSVILLWKTTSEINTDSFEIEKSLDGKLFYKIGSVNAVGNLTNITSYKFPDQLKESGFHYYRLKMIDKDGKYSYSNVITVLIDQYNSNSFFMFPNPANATVNIIGKDIFSISLYSIQGAEIFQKKMEGMSSTSIDISTLSKGIYVVAVRLKNGQRQIKKLIVY